MAFYSQNEVDYLKINENQNKIELKDNQKHSVRVECNFYDTDRELNIYGCNMSISHSSKNLVFTFGYIYTFKKNIGIFQLPESVSKGFYYGINYRHKLLISIESLKITNIKPQQSDSRSLENGEKWCDVSMKSSKILFCGYTDLNVSAKCEDKSEYSCPSQEVGIKLTRKDGSNLTMPICIISILLLVISTSYNIYIMRKRRPVEIEF
ncbi:hypothetical protein RF11_04035 [Thelohanellus kitauei]|uniref:Uncharacterized protein n=1 Tax=Thelohanellus kitauei TaxID=669202 RepID=A0A0C2N591_THEKT|nr:hypothetical protein RF11_04035 [Thelohanellus kitauei]